MTALKLNRDLLRRACFVIASVALFASAAGAEELQLKVIGVDPDGHGALCKVGPKMVLWVSGTPEQMGKAHGYLTGQAPAKLAERVLYLVGGGESVVSGEWFLDKMEEIDRRTAPFIPERFTKECDALAAATGVSRRDARYANLFPERFHCSGMAVAGKATVGGCVLHARVLDYMRDIRLQDAALIQVYMPDEGYKWVSLGYAGFIGTVTAMNEKGVAIGEMGGHGVGDWDGMPMNFLLRDVMERAATVDEAIKIIKETPRTCEYYYVVSDKCGDMRGLHCTAKEIEVLMPGQQDPRLPHVPEDTILISGDERAKVLSQRIQDNYGKIDAQKMIEIIKRPVAMQSNLHNAIFSPQTGDMWFADAGRDTPACDEPYFRCNFEELIRAYKRVQITREKQP